MSVTAFTPESASATIWKYCGYRFATWHTFVTFCGYGGAPLMPSTDEMLLPNPMS